MPGLDRSRLVELLGRLGDEKDEVVLAAARELSRTVATSGYDWNGLLAPDGAEGEAELDAEPAASASPEVESAPKDKSGELKIIERLLARKDISDTLRSDLQDFKRTLAEGKLDKMDVEYIHALAKRLDA